MRNEEFIVVAAEDDRGLHGQVSGHFGRCPFYVLVEAEGETVTGSVVIANPYFGAHQPNVIPRFIHNIGASAIIAGGMGRRAIDMFHDFGIDVATGVTGTVAVVLGAYLHGEHRGVAPCAHDHHPTRCGEEEQRQLEGGDHG